MKRFGAALALWCTFFSVYPAWGQAIILKPGQSAPSDGVFLPTRDAIEAAKLADKVDALQLEIKAADEQIKAQIAMVELLEREVASLEKETELKDLVIKLKDEMLAFRKEMNEEWKQIAAHSKEQLTQDRVAIEKLQKMVEDANSRGFWTTLIGTILGVLGMAALLAL